MDKKDWTIMVYMAGDNNLSEDMVTGLIGMRENLSESPQIALTAYYDSEAQGFPTVFADFTINEPDKRFEYPTFRNDALPSSELIKPLGEEKSSIYTITNFVRHSIKKHPARNYALIFSGHGDGYQADNFLRDHNPSSSITIFDLRRNLCYMKKELLDNQNFGIIGFDSCVMNTLEVTFQIADTADTVIASQGFVPNAGWDFRRIIRRLRRAAKTSETRIEKKDLIKAMTESFIVANKDYAFYSGRSADIGSCELNKIPNVKDAVHELGTSLLGALKSPAVKHIAEQLILHCHLKSQTHLFEQSVDIKDFCSLLAGECAAVIREKTELKSFLPATETVRRAKTDSIIDSLKTVSKSCRKVIREVEQCAECFSLGSEYIQTASRFIFPGLIFRF